MDHEDSGKHFSFLRLLYQRILGRIRAFLRYCSTHPYYQWFKTLKAILPLIWWIRSLCLPISHHTYVERCVPNLVCRLTYVSAQRSVGSSCIGQVCFLIIDIVSYWVSYRFLFIELFFGITLAYTIQSFYCWRIFVSEYDVLRVFESSSLDAYTISVSHRNYFVCSFVVSLKLLQFRSLLIYSGWSAHRHWEWCMVRCHTPTVANRWRFLAAYAGTGLVFSTNRITTSFYSY